MKPIFHEPRGEEAERRFLEYAQKRTSKTPSWFNGVRRSSIKFDVKGVDICASIKRPDDEKPMTVPIQIKSSEGGKRAYYQSHPDARAVRVPVLVITDTMTSEEIRKKLYRTLKPFLTCPRDHFKHYLEGLGKSRLSKRGQAIKAHIKKTRQKS